MFKYLRGLNNEEKRTFRLHFIYSLIEGILTGSLALNEFVLIKSLKGTNYQIAFLFQFSVIVLLFSIIFNELLKRTSKKRILLRRIGILTRLPLILLFFFPTTAAEIGLFHQLLFLSIFLIYFMASPIILPTINLLLKNNYDHDNFGRLYGYSTSANKIVMLVITFLFGLLLDLDNFAFVYVYPFLGVLGMISIIILTRINYTAKEIIIKKTYIQSIKESFSNMISIIKTNRPYRDFEIGFMLYGFAWMVTSAVITIFFDKKLDLNYSSIAFYKNSYNTLAIVILPFFGKLLGKIDPRKFGIYTFGSLMLFIFFMGLTEFVPNNFEILGITIYYSLIASYTFYGIFAATMALLWFIGSAYFCSKAEASNYQSIHLSLTGFRGLFAPLIGIYFYELIGFAGVFGIGVVSLLIAIILMFYSMKKEKMQKQTD